MARPKKKRKGLRENGVFEYKATIGHTLDGKRIRKSFYSSKSLADAKAQAEQYKADQAVFAATGIPPINESCMTFGEWAARWLHTYKKPFVSRATYENTYVYAVEKHLNPYFGNAQLSNIRSVDVQLFFVSKISYSLSIQKKLLNTIHAIFESAIDNEIIYKNPAKNIKLKSTAAPHKKRALTDAQIAFVKSAAADTFAAVIFLLETGLRRGELLGLMWKDIDLDAGTLTVSRSFSIEHGKGVIVPPKWNSYRTLPLLPSTLELLKKQPRTSLYVFPAPRSNKTEDPNHFSRRLKNFFDALPEEYHCSAHELRHTYASQLMRRGVDIYTIQQLLGHKDISVTTQVYVHPDPERFRTDLLRAFPVDQEQSCDASF